MQKFTAFSVDPVFCAAAGCVSTTMAQGKPAVGKTVWRSEWRDASKDLSTPNPSNREMPHAAASASRVEFCKGGSDGRCAAPEWNFRTTVKSTLMFLLLLGLSGGCGLDENAIVECRCTPSTNLTLFPACPRIDEVIELEGKEHWVTAQGDTLDPKVERFTVRGDVVELARLGASNPFATQIPDCPTGPRLILLQPTRPELVILNLRLIFQAQPEARNAGQYMDQLTDDFTFIPDEEDIQLYPEVYDVSRDTLWNYQQERRFAQAVLDPSRIGRIVISRWYESSKDERILSEDQLLETFRFPYEGEFNERTGEGESASALGIKGWMEVDLISPTIENPVWSIRQWRDYRDPATARRSWGELRAEFGR
jgi:hypothetical protein